MVAARVIAIVALAAPGMSFFSTRIHDRNSCPSKTTTRTSLGAGLRAASKTNEEKMIATENEALLARLRSRVDKINALEKSIEKLKDSELRAKTKEFRQRLAEGSSLDELLEEAFAVVREAAWRVLELRHFDVQLLGGMVLHAGRLAEMATGEGKTLAATLPTYLAALEGRGALVVTANEYLAKRDAETVGQVYRFLGLTVGLVQAALAEPDRQAAYKCDVTFATNSELGFDYLRDNLALSPAGVVMLPDGKGPTFCLVDEADSILIDEARTPLIISKQVAAPKEKYDVAAAIAGALREDQDYRVDIKGQQVTMTEAGFTTTEGLLGKPLFDLADPWAPFVLNALKAKALFEKNVQYIVRDGVEVCIVDAFSGRVMAGRRWSDGLHQSIEAKEGIPVSTESQVIATVTFQALFRRYPRLCGMSGTALGDAKEFAKVYGLAVTPVPTALPVGRRDYPDVVYRTQAAKQRAVVAEVVRARNVGRPVLVGTTSVQASEELAAALRLKLGEGAAGGADGAAGAADTSSVLVLNARPENLGKEGFVVAQAGRLGAVTVATNMAGRGTDILLGGNPGLMAKLRVRDAVALALGVGGVAPVDAGFFPTDLSADAALLVGAAAAALAGSGGVDDAAELEELVSVAAERAPLNDKGVLALRAAYEAVKRDFAAALAPEKEAVRALGGLYVVGTERHESQRIDRQLRGRSGRQGDPGGSRFFLSMDDKMLRTFGADRMKTVLDAFRVAEDVPLDAPMVTDAIDKVQARVEDYYSEIRAQVFTFDDVLATQRQSLYARRSEVLGGADDALVALMGEWCAATVRDIVPNYARARGAGGGLAGGVDGEGLAAKVAQFFPGMAPLDPTALAAMDPPAALAAVNTAVAAALAAKMASVDKLRPRQFSRVAQYLSLAQFDNKWSEHLRSMSLLKESVAMRKFSGRDVLQEYIADGAQLFEEMLANARRSTVYSLFAYQLPSDATQPVQQVR